MKIGKSKKRESGKLGLVESDEICLSTGSAVFCFPIFRFSDFHMTPDELQTLIEDATFDHAMGETDAALAKLAKAAAAAPGSFEAWHAIAEINFSLRRLDAALAAAEKAHALRPDDLFINTSLSRIWMEKGDKAKAEHFGAQAKIQSWKDQLKTPGDPA
jgi:predicted Zn-dependent protease